MIVQILQLRETQSWAVQGNLGIRIPLKLVIVLREEIFYL